MHWAAMQGSFDPAMMQQAASMMADPTMMQQAANMMATLQQQQHQQQGQGGFPGGAQFFFPGMQMPPGAQPAQPQGAAAAPVALQAQMQATGGVLGQGGQAAHQAVMMPGSTAPQAGPAAAALEGQGTGKDFARAFQECVDSLSQVESEYYMFLWEQAGCAHSQALQGKAAFDFLSKSQLPRDILKRIWDLADWQKLHCLSWREFAVTMKLISAAQKKQLVSLERVLENCSPTSMDCPEFVGISTASTFRGGPGSSSPPASSPRDQAASPAEAKFMPPAEAAPTPAGAQVPGAVAGAPAVVAEPLADWAATTGPARIAGAGASTTGTDALSQAWDAFGSLPGLEHVASPMDAPSQPVAPAAEPAGPVSTSMGQVEESQWAEFSAVPPPAKNEAALSPAATAADSWADFAAAPSDPPAVDASAGNAGAPWADFGSPPSTGAVVEGAPAGVPPSMAPPGGAGQGDLWSKMSAFDDLLKEDEALGGSAAAQALGEAFAAEAPLAAPAGPAAVPDLPVGIVPAPTSSEDRAEEDWGDFATGETAPPPAGVHESINMGGFAGGSSLDAFGGDADGFGAFSGGGFADFGGNQGESAGDMGGGAHATSQSPNSGDETPTDEAWSAFAGTVSPEPSSGPGAGISTALSTSPKAVSSDASPDMFVAADFGGMAFDPPGATLGESPLGLSDSPVCEDAGLDWADFAAAAAPSPDVVEPSSSSSRPRITPVDGSPGRKAEAPDQPFPMKAVAAQPSLETSSNSNAAWAAFDDVGSGPALEVAPSSAQDMSSGLQFPEPSGTAAEPAFAFDFEDSGTAVPDARPQASLVADHASAGAALAGAGTEAGDSTWGAFEFDGLSAAAPATAPPVPSVHEPGGAWTGLASHAKLPPSPLGAASPAKLSPAALGGEELPDNEFSQLARSLAALGHFEEAERCLAHAGAQRRLDTAEARKKEAVANDDFEGAIQIRNEVKALSAELAPSEAVEGWQRLAARGEAEAGLEASTERLRQRCQYLDSALDRAALGVAVGNFRSTCPLASAPSDLRDLPSLVQRQRRAQQMSRAIEAVSSTNVFHFVQALLICLGSLAELLGSCNDRLHDLCSPEWSDEERELVVAAGEFQGFLSGLSGLRRVMWRLDIAAELFIPHDVDADASCASGVPELVDVGEVPEEDMAALKELHVGVRSCLGKARTSWTRLEAELSEIKSELSPWNPGSCLEAGGGAAARQRSSPLCGLCLLPSIPLGFQAQSPEDQGAAAVMFKGGLWHIQCANFWAMNGAKSRFFRESGIADPFAKPG